MSTSTQKSPTGQPTTSPFNVVEFAPKRSLAQRLLETLVIRRRDFTAKYGYLFGSARKLNDALGYPEDHELTYTRLLAEYRRDGMAAKVVDMLPEAVWKIPPIVTDDSDPRVVTPFQQAVEDLAERLNLWGVMELADKQSRLGEYSVIILGGRGTWDKPMPAGTLDYLTPLPQSRVTINETDIVKSTSASQNSARFQNRIGWPQLYQVTFTKNSTPQPVHWTRVLHLVDQVIDDPIRAEPVLVRVFNRLQDRLKLVGGGSEAAWVGMMGRHLFDIDPDMPFKAGEEEALKDEIQEMVDALKPFARTRGVTPKPVSSMVWNFDKNAIYVAKEIAAAAGVPWRLFLGAESSHQASTQDRHNFEQTAAARFTRVCRPRVRDFVDRCIALELLPEPNGGRYITTRPPIDTLTESDRAVATRWIANANKASVAAGLGPVLSVAKIRHTIWGLTEPVEDISNQASEQGDNNE